MEYKETIQSENALYIVLEFVENGSLAQVLKRFGTFPETLTAVYVCQVRGPRTHVSLHACLFCTGELVVCVDV